MPARMQSIATTRASESALEMLAVAQVRQRQSRYETVRQARWSTRPPASRRWRHRRMPSRPTISQHNSRLLRKRLSRSFLFGERTTPSSLMPQDMSSTRTVPRVHPWRNRLALAMPVPAGFWMHFLTRVSLAPRMALVRVRFSWTCHSLTSLCDNMLAISVRLTTKWQMQRSSLLRMSLPQTHRGSQISRQTMCLRSQTLTLSLRCNHHPHLRIWGSLTLTPASSSTRRLTGLPVRPRLPRSHRLPKTRTGCLPHRHLPSPVRERQTIGNQGISKATAETTVPCRQVTTVGISHGLAMTRTSLRLTGTMPYGTCSKTSAMSLMTKRPSLQSSEEGLAGDTLTR